MKLLLVRTAYFVLILSGTPMIAEEVDEQILELEAKLCAPKRPTDEAKTDAGFCTECAAAAASTIPGKVPVAELTESEKHEFAYLASLHETGRSLAEMKANLNQERADLEATRKKIAEIKKQLFTAAEFFNHIDEAIESGSGFTVSDPAELKSLITQEITTLRNKLAISEKQIAKWSDTLAKKPSLIVMYEESLKRAEKTAKDSKSALEPMQKLLDHVAMERGAVLTNGDLTALQHFATVRRDRLRGEYDSKIERKTGSENVIPSLEQSILNLQASVDKITTESLSDPRAALAKLRAKHINRLVIRPRTAANCGLSAGEHLALASYTENAFGAINEELRKGASAEFKHQIALIKSALQKFTSYKGATRRGVDFPRAVLDQHQPGQIVSYPAFSSTSLMAGFGGAHQLIIHSKSGRYIAPYSTHRGEHEVLFPPTRFKVISRENKPDGKVNIVLQELD